MLHAVFLLVAASELMLFDSAFHVVIYPGSDHEAILSAAIHGLCIDIVIVFIVLHEPAFFLEFLEILYSFVVYFGVMFISAGFEINFGFDDVVERFGISFSFFASFFAVEHVIRA